MREIKFRAKYGKKWIFGNCIEQDKKNNTYLIARREAGFFPQKWVEVESETIGQYTGFTDKKGQEIYEGDILQNCPRSVTYIAEWSEAGYWKAEALSALHHDVLRNICDSFVIIGNIHDNPELLNQ